MWCHAPCMHYHSLCGNATLEEETHQKYHISFHFPFSEKENSWQRINAPCSDEQMRLEKCRCLTIVLFLPDSLSGWRCFGVIDGSGIYLWFLDICVRMDLFDGLEELG